MDKNVEFVIKQADGSVTYDIEKFASVQDAEFAEWKSGDRTVESLEKIMLKRLDPSTFVSGKGKSTWKKFVQEKFEFYTNSPDGCYCERLDKKVSNAAVDETVSVDLGSTNYGGMDLQAVKEKDGTIFYSFGIFADGEAYSDGVMYCPFCGKKLKRS